MYGSIKVVYRDGSENTYDTYIGHLVKFEREHGTFSESITSAALVGHIVSESHLSFDDWLATVKYVEPVPDQTDLGDRAEAGEAAEPVPTQ